MKNKCKVFIEASLTGNKFNGHYNYCLNLGLALSKLSYNKFKFIFVLMNSNKVFKVPSPLKAITFRVYKYFYRFFIKPDIWHVTYQLTDLLPMNKCKLLLTIHDLNFLIEEKDGDVKKRYLNVLQSNIDRADSISTISNYVKESILTNCDLKGKEINVIYNGGYIPQNLITSLPVKSVRAPLSYILSIGVIARKKNIHVLPYLLLGNELELVICGYLQDENYLNEVLDIAKRLGVDRRIKYLGAVTEEDKLLLLRDCALFAFPSMAEGFGLPIIEAMSFGKKILLSTYTCLPEIGGKYAYYIQRDDEEYMINFAYKELPIILQNDQNIVKLIERAKCFTWDRAAREYESIYSQLNKK